MYRHIQTCKKQIRSYVILRKLRRFRDKGVLIPIEVMTQNSNIISEYWTGYTVHDDCFLSSKERLDYRNKIWDMYPGYREFADMDRLHGKDTILDYGCGLGNDLTWYTQMTNPDYIIGSDISRAVLENAQFRMALHDVSKEKCRLIQLDDSEPVIPLENESIDYISCQGVLMHTSYPRELLGEFWRLLKKSDKSCACIMV